MSGDGVLNRLAVLSNAHSRANQRGGHWSLLSLRDLRGPHEVTQTVDELPAALDALLAARPDALAVNGGDGTLQTLLSACLRRGELWRLPPLAVLPGGTTNMSALDLSGEGALPAALRAFAALQHRPRGAWPIVRRSVMEIHCGDGGRYAGLIFGLGTLVRGVEFWQDAVRRSARAGDWGLGVAVGRTAWGIVRRDPSYAGATRLGARFGDGDVEPLEISALMVTSLRRMVMGMRPFWGGEEGALACTWMDARPRQLLVRLPALMWGRGAWVPDAAGYHSCRAERVSFEVDEPWLLDGEVLPAAGRLVVSASLPLPFLYLKETPG